MKCDLHINAFSNDRFIMARDSIEVIILSWFKLILSWF